ncbi:hypothetical protein BDZ89DRAFT_1167163 [Hymenopellis radicata]|nr:hypothetical protein BDZ89DRAFT_1167163 [Hymenopellis radicata]
MPFTPEDTLVIRSREFGDGSEYNLSSTSSIIPDHYVKRLWRKPPLMVGAGAVKTIQFINKDHNSNDRSVAYSATESEGTMRIWTGGYGDDGSEIGSLQLGAGTGLKTLEKSSTMTLENKTGVVKAMLKKTNHMSTSRTFTGPDGVDYKWKVIWVGNDPAFPETTFRELHTKDSNHPIATTARLTRRDGTINDEAYPVYIAERGIRIQSWIVATLIILDRIGA